MRLRTEGLSMQELDGEAVLLDTRTSRYLSVNAVGTVVLRGLARDADRGELLEDVLETFDVPRDRAEADLDVFLRQLSDAGLLEGGDVGLSERARTVKETLLAAALLVLVELGLHLVPLERLCARLGVRLSRVPQPDSPPALMPRWTRVPLAAAERVCAVWPVGPEGKCLRRCLVAGQRLRGLDPVLVLGVRRAPERIEAHAWLVVLGGALDPTASDFAQLPVPEA